MTLHPRHGDGDSHPPHEDGDWHARHRRWHARHLRWHARHRAMHRRHLLGRLGLRGPGWPIRAYIRARLHRRIFVWFGLSIALTMACVAGVVSLFSNQMPFHEELARAETFFGRQLGQVWHAPEARDRLLADMARDFDASVTALDASGRQLGSFGGPCRHTLLDIQVIAPDATGTPSSDGARNSSESPNLAGPGGVLGQVQVCRSFKASRPWMFLLSLFVTGACLWLASGAISGRLIRPLGRVVEVARDIGDGKLDSRVKLPRRHSCDELGMLATAINDMAGRIEKQMADQRELLAAVSHELRTPLGHVRVLVDILRDCPDEADRLARIGEIEQEVVEIDALVGQLLASSRLVFDTIDRRPLDAAEIALRALDRAGLPDTLLVIDGADGDSAGSSILVAGDPTLLSRALANLLDNARSHGGGVAALRIVTGPGDLAAPHDSADSADGDDGAGGDDRREQVRFEVLDSGPGFAEGEADKVFDTFYRGAHRAGQSSLGLGLALVARIARAHGGVAFAENRAPGGARVGFTVVSPATGERTG